MNDKPHVGVTMVKQCASGAFVIAYRECWCGAIWLAPSPVRAESRPGEHDPVALWCPNAPVGPDTVPLDGVLMLSVTKGATEPFDVRLHSRGMSVWLSSFDSKGRSLLVAHAFHRAFGGTHGWPKLLARELQSYR